MFQNKHINITTKAFTFPFITMRKCLLPVCSGYMSPEYAMHGQFSVKSDVYSFGVLIFEIITGKKNSSFYQSDCAEDLLSYVSIYFTIVFYLPDDQFQYNHMLE